VTSSRSGRRLSAQPRLTRSAVDLQPQGGRKASSPVNLNDRRPRRGNVLLLRTLGGARRAGRRGSRRTLSAVLADSGQLEQVLVNLAVKRPQTRCPPGGRLHIETAEVELDRDFRPTAKELSPGRHVRLTVADHPARAWTTRRSRERSSRSSPPSPRGRGPGLASRPSTGSFRGAGGQITIYSEQGGRDGFQGSPAGRRIAAVPDDAEASAGEAARRVAMSASSWWRTRTRSGRWAHRIPVASRLPGNRGQQGTGGPSTCSRIRTRNSTCSSLTW